MHLQEVVRPYLVLKRKQQSAELVMLCMMADTASRSAWMMYDACSPADDNVSSIGRLTRVYIAQYFQKYTPCPHVYN